jgi:predicted nucleic acid-binding protein
MGTIDALHAKRVYLDTNFFIYALEHFTPTADVVTKIAQMIEDGALAAFTSELTLAETLVIPARKGDERLIRLYGEFISSRDGLTVVPVTREVWVDAAHVRASSSFKLPDAVHIATARRTACDVFVTNDRAFSSLSGLTVHYLEARPPQH